MKFNGNGHKDEWPSSVSTDTCSYADQAQPTRSIGDDEEIIFESQEMEAAAADPGAETRQKQRRKKIISVVAVLLFVTSVGGATAYYLIHRSMKLDVIVGNQRTNAIAPQSDAATSGNNLTQQALKEMHEATKNSSTKNSSTSSPVTINQSETQSETQPETMTQATRGTALPEGLAGTIRTLPSIDPGIGQETDTDTKIRTDAATSQSGVSPEVSPGVSRSRQNSSLVTHATTSRRNAEKSIRMIVVEETEVSNTRPTLQATAKQADRSRVVRQEREVVVPSFGAMLPVRTLGAIYTLRSSTLARFELTRDISGEGWSLKRGTVFIGTLRGGEYDRAYMSMIGFIDSASGRLIKVGGEVLGSDGGTGLKGKRRRLSSRGLRFLAEASRSGVGLAQSALSGRNGGATIILPGLQGTAQTELSTLGGQGNNREFVEVAAGVPAYVMITELPETIKGVDAMTKLEPDALTQALDVNERGSSGLTDAELATLLSSGSTDEIREALPQMTPSLRRVAQAMLEQTGKVN
ncbi:MAG: hypothetical protein ACRD63_01650 [Pyrinomonadaceae bacterium]